jgi:hypothetical protein
MTQIYHYDPVTGVFLGSDVARQSPLEPDTILLPANATTTAPPACTVGEQPVFTGGAWVSEEIPVPPVAPPPTAAEVAAEQWAVYQVGAQVALTDSDTTILRCYENSVTVPAVWATYRKALRAIIGATTGDATQPLPVRPAYPAGT